MIPFRIGADASCTDGACGQVSRIIVNPVTREVTHLAVDPKHRHGPGRLVPVDLVDATTSQIRLRCPLAEFQRLRLAQETEGGTDLDPSGHPGNAPKKVNWVVADGAVIMQPGARGEPEAPQQVTVDYVPARRDRSTPRTDRLCDRRRHRAGPGVGRGTWQPPGNPRAPPAGAHAGPQGSGYPDRRRDQDRDPSHPSQPHQTPGERPTPRRTLIPCRGHPVPRPGDDHLVRDDAESGARGLLIPGADTEEVRSGDGLLSVRGCPSTVKGTRRSFQTRSAEMIFRTRP